MKRFIYPLLSIVFVPLPAIARPQPAPPVPYLAAAIADGAPFVLQLHPGENNGTLIGGESYLGNYNRDSNTFTVSGRGLREDGVVIALTATYGGAEPVRQELSVWGALYTFDPRGNVFLGTSGRLAGKLSLRK